MTYCRAHHCTAGAGKDYRLDIFGSGGGERVAATLQAVRLRRACPRQHPARHLAPRGRARRQAVVEADPMSLAAAELTAIAEPIHGRGRGLAGMQLGLTPEVRRVADGPGRGGVFGIGFGELVVIAFLAVLSSAPTELPELARQAGQFSARSARSPTTPATSCAPSWDRVRRPRAQQGISTPGRSCASTSPRSMADGTSHVSADALRRRLEAGERPPYDLEAT